MREFVVIATVGAALAGPAAAQGASSARQPAQPVPPPAHETAQSKPAQSDAERERLAREQGLSQAELFSQAELYRRRESGLDEGQPLRC